MTVRDSSASARAAGSTGCSAYSRQASIVLLNPRLLDASGFASDKVEARVSSLQASVLPEPGSCRQDRASEQQQTFAKHVCSSSNHSPSVTFRVHIRSKPRACTGQCRRSGQRQGLAKKPPETGHLCHAVRQKQALGRPSGKIPRQDDEYRGNRASVCHDEADHDRRCDETRQINPSHHCATLQRG